MSALCIAHRGASGEAPVNTLQAFELAIEQRADMIETDLHLTREGRIVLAHNSNLRGVEFATQSFEELRLRAPELPTLEEALALCGDRIPFNLELKTGVGGRYQGLERRVLDVVRGFDLLDRTLFSCFDDRVLRNLRDLEPAARIALLVAPRTDVEVETRARRLGAEAGFAQADRRASGGRAGGACLHRRCAGCDPTPGPGGRRRDLYELSRASTSADRPACYRTLAGPVTNTRSGRRSSERA